MSKRKFSTAEANYSPDNREALAIVWSLDKCRDYLELVPFVLYTNHESLAAFRLQPTNLKNRDWRWQERLSRFDFEIRYRNGGLPDASMGRMHYQERLMKDIR